MPGTVCGGHARRRNDAMHTVLAKATLSTPTSCALAHAAICCIFVCGLSMASTSSACVAWRRDVTLSAGESSLAGAVTSICHVEISCDTVTIAMLCSITRWRHSAI